MSTPLSAPDDADAVLIQNLNAIGFEPGTCFYYVQASPSPPSVVGRFYRGAPDSLYDLLSNIPQLRSSGFSLPDGFTPERTHGGGIRVVWPRNDSVSITPNGLTTAIEGQEHLTWASSKVAPEGQVWINPLALVEFTLEFWRFYVGQVQARIDGQVKTIWRAGMRALGGPLPAYLPSSFVRRATKERPDADDFDLKWETTDERDPGRLAFHVLSRLYARFGFAEEIIPWAENRRVSEEQILSIRRGG